MIDPQDITGLVLAGGRGSRMGGVDKGLQLYHGVPLALHALRRLQAQVGAVRISANRHLADYAAFGVPVCSDADSDYAGPLAGFLAGLDHCATPWLLTVPCDAPLFPSDLARRLADAAHHSGARVAVASAPERNAQGAWQLRTQPVFCLLHTSLQDKLLQFTRAGGRQVGTWLGQQDCAMAPFDGPHDDPRAFANANTLDELRALHGRA